MPSSEVHFHASASAGAIVMQRIVGKELAQGPCVAARAGLEPATLQTKIDESTNKPQRPKLFFSISSFNKDRCQKTRSMLILTLYIHKYIHKYSVFI